MQEKSRYERRYKDVHRMNIFGQWIDVQIRRPENFHSVSTSDLPQTDLVDIYLAVAGVCDCSVGYYSTLNLYNICTYEFNINQLNINYLLFDQLTQHDIFMRYVAQNSVRLSDLS